MKITLYTGDGWTPFTYDEGEVVTWNLPVADDLDLPASVARLSELFAARVREVYADDEVEVLPAADGGGELVTVDLSDASPEEADSALALNAEDLADPGFDPAAMIAGEIEGLLDGIITDQTHAWKVAR